MRQALELPQTRAGLVVAGQLAWCRARGGRRRFRGQRMLTAVLGGGAAALALAGAATVWSQQTTVDPRDPGRASSLVTRGVFGWSRNPIYLADLLAVAAVAAATGRVANLLAVPVLQVLLTPQVEAEEAALATRFGADYDAYRYRVRRWL